MPRRSLPLIAALLGALLLAVAPAASASAPSFGFKSFGVELSGTQAGSHPDATVNFELNNSPGAGGLPELAEGKEIKNLTVELPPGLVGDPSALPQCPRRLFDAEVPLCPSSTQVGTDTVRLPVVGHLGFPVYNLVPPPGTPAEFAFNLFGIHGVLDFALRGPGEEGYGLNVDVYNVAQRGIIANTTTIWGDPADPSHEAKRCAVVNGLSKCGLPFEAPPRALLTLPAACTGPLHFRIAATSWQEPNAPPVTASAETPGMSGCGRFDFGPSLSLAPDTTHAETPAGLTAEVKVPEDTGLTSPTEPRTESDLRDTTVVLPAGLTVNPGQVAGLVACQPAQENLEEPQLPAACPAASRVGTASIETPLLPDRVEGDVYVLQSAPPHLQLLVAASADGVNLKLIGDVHLDPTTGRLTTVFSNTPPLPFTSFKLSFSGGAQAAVSTPPACGTYATAARFTPWSSPFAPDIFGGSAFAIDAGAAGSASCPPAPLPFGPRMIAGSSTDQAGAFTGFSMLLTRADGQQRIERLQFKAPPGLVGMISKLPLCGEPQASQGTCPAASRIGHTVVEAGPGPFPLVVPEPGRTPAAIYLTGPYEGQPFGLSIATPLLAGPFDLGTIVTRASIAVDPKTAQITITTGPLPQIVAGAPTDLRAIDAVVDRPDFMINPTDCEPLSFSGTAASAEGATAPLSSRFRVGSCRELAFKPRLGIGLRATAKRRGRKPKQDKLGLGGSMKRGGHPTLSTVLRMNGGPEAKHPEANVKTLSVQLPHSAFLDQAHIRTICTRVQFAAGVGHGTDCPPGSVYGHAKAISPLLAQPLEGNVYLRSSSHNLPDLLIALIGPPSQPVAVDLDGRVDSVHGGIRTTFEAVPDAPVSKFFLQMQGGKKGLIVNSTDLCASVNKATVKAAGQNGSAFRSKVTVVPQCPKRRRSHRRHGRRKA